VTVFLLREGYEAVATWLHSCIRSPLRLVRWDAAAPAVGSRPGEGVHGEGVDYGKVGDGDVFWQGHEDVAPSLGANGPSSAEVPAPAARLGSPRRGGSRVEAMPPRCTARRKKFQDVMVQRDLCGEGGALHAVVGVHTVEGGSAAALHGGGNEGQDGEAEAVSEGSLERTTHKFKGS
jgi:hypothetical protein